MIELVMGLVAGWCMGIIVNYLADVLPIKRRLVAPFCLACDNGFQLINYFFFPRKCLSCGKSRIVRVWFVELFLAGAGFMLIVAPLPALHFGWSLLLLGYLALITVIDLEHRLILHLLSLIGAFLAGWIGYQLHGWLPTLIGGLVGFGTMLALYFLGLAFISISRKMRRQQITEDEAIGFGDVNLSGVIGLLLGWPGVIAGLVLAVVLAGLVSLIYLISMVIRKGYHPNMALPYGPFLTGSAFFLLFLRHFFF